MLHFKNVRKMSSIIRGSHIFFTLIFIMIVMHLIAGKNVSIISAYIIVEKR